LWWIVAIRVAPKDELGSSIEFRNSLEGALCDGTARLFVLRLICLPGSNPA
jgi:hypothetical protein